MKSCKIVTYILLAATGLISVVAFCLVFVSQVYATQFPVYDCIKPNVDFWKKIYAQYSLSQGVVHDKDNLGIIYEVIDLKSGNRYTSRSDIQKKVTSVKNKYRDLLLRLAKNPQPKSPEEKRVLRLFGANPTAERLRTAAENIRFQLGQKNRFQEGVVRSGAYLAEIQDIFKEHGVPSDLAYLAHVESSFNYQAYSKFGAAGIWQFTRSTGKLFMKVDYALDERRDPIRSSKAAAQLLKQNHDRLGEWPLAITAYNHGAGGVARAVKSEGDYQGIFMRHNGNAFGFASRNFYSEFLAAREVAKDYLKYFGTLDLAPPARSHAIQLDGYVPINDLASYFGVNIDTLKSMNPALREPVFLGRKHIPKGYTLRLPSEVKDRGRLAAALPSDLYRSTQKRSRFYRVQRGDTAGLVARMHGVSLRELTLANNLGSRTTIYAGQNLRIPGVGEDVTLLSKSYKQQGDGFQQVATGRGKEKKETFIVKGESKSAPSEIILAKNELSGTTANELPLLVSSAFGHLDQDGSWPQDEMMRAHSPEINYGEDDYWELSRTGLSLSDEKVVEGPAARTRVLLPELNPEVVMGNIQVEKVFRKDGRQLGIIRVEAEETLGHYADWLEIPTQKVRSYNGLRYGRGIKVNQAIKIPFGKVGKDEFEEKRYEYHKEMEENFFAAFEIDDIRKYKIRKGDNIWTLCRGKFDLPFWLLRKVNGLVDFNTLKPDQEILVPVVAKKEINPGEPVIGENYSVTQKKSVPDDDKRGVVERQQVLARPSLRDQVSTPEG
ncbi:MAG: transglycosylase SLT domain-containing protein [Proteobacteria bacterium]|nr:transglycosylase SLT domain-containing protein [Pseudomonadota bacterium]MBU1715605.1 transglycosylase SLT domain-containing protein [Pseudomonadota bacterium]